LIRRALTDEEWRRIEPLIPGKKGDKGRHGADNRLFVDAVFGWSGPERPGAICRKSSASGTVCSNTRAPLLPPPRDASGVTHSTGALRFAPEHGGQFHDDRS
jgi:hypothetical protein